MMIEATDLRAGYGDGADILNGISLQAGRRELVTILGPNGCGKSTLLKTLAGYVQPRAGLGLRQAALASQGGQRLAQAQGFGIGNETRHGRQDGAPACPRRGRKGLRRYSVCSTRVTSGT